jgi:hypothetical protein
MMPTTKHPTYSKTNNPTLYAKVDQHNCLTFKNVYHHMPSKVPFGLVFLVYGKQLMQINKFLYIIISLSK